MILPEDFTNQLQQLLGIDYEAFVESLHAPSPTSIRINPSKNNGDFQSLEPILWADGFYLEKRPIFTLDPAFHAGAYYVQEASSMILGWVLRQLVDTSQPVRALDLCAAPGGKSTLMASVLHSDSLLLCNEVIKSRIGILKENIQKWGQANVHISNHDPEDFEDFEHFFDVVLVDAPCSGEGLFRKDPNATNEWSLANVELCAGRQKRILEATLPLIKPNGLLIYCTCTYNDSENEANARWIAENGFEEIKLEIPTDWGITNKEFGYQCYPHKVKGEGFFFSIFKKNDAYYEGYEKVIGRKLDFKSFKKIDPKQQKLLTPWLENADEFEFFVKPNHEIIALLKKQLDELLFLDKHLFSKGLGLILGELKGKDFVPSHGLALSIAVNKNIARIELDKTDAIRFLRRENIEIDAPKGWFLVCYDGLPLGWCKGLGNRVNNYLPKEWRIRMENVNEN